MTIKRTDLRLDDFLYFGKHKGMQVEDLLDDDPGYLCWLYEENAEIFDSEVLKEMEKRKII